MLRSVHLLILAVAAIAAMAPSAAARATLDVTMGWDGSVRSGRWTPIFVTVADSATREAMITLDMPQAGPYVMELRQFVTIGPYPTTLTLYVPAQANYSDPPMVVLRDAETDKTLAEWPEDPDAVSRRYELTVRSNEHFVGVSGPILRLGGLEQNTGVSMRVGGIKPQLLPDQPVGYDALDLLVLHRADLNSIERVRQQAIADWVRQGGCLLLWPSPEPTPADSPIGQILPCRVGGPKNYVIAAEQRSRTGLQERFKGIVGYELTPTADAEPIELLPLDDGGAAMTAHARDYGFGRVIVSPIDLNELAFNSSSDGSEFFKPVLAGTGLQAVDQTSGSYYGLDPATQVQQSAISSLLDHLADVPGAGRFGFSYVVWIVLGMMAVVGPVDWFILKRLGRQPWTWITTTGWIATITIGALFIGQIFKSGDLHYRTVTLIDQAGDQTVARTTLLGIYSPRTTEYDVDAAPTQLDAEGKPVPTLRPPAGWWEPASATSFGGGGMKVDVPFRQTTEGNLPQAMTINVWNMRAMRGENLVAGDPVIKADLSYLQTGSDWRLSGTITNLSQHPLKDIRIDVRDGYIARTGDTHKPQPLPALTDDAGYDRTANSVRNLHLMRSLPLIERLEPGQSAELDGVAKKTIAAGADRSENNYPRYYGDSQPPDPNEVWAFATGLSGRRTQRTDTLIAAGTHAAVYAMLDSADPPAVLRKNEGAIERHQTVMRAVVPVKTER